MTIFELLKSLKRGYFYNVPADPFANEIKYCLVNHHEAGNHLCKLRNRLSEKHIITFELEKPQSIPVWIIEKNQMEETNVVKVNVIVKEK